MGIFENSTAAQRWRRLLSCSSCYFLLLPSPLHGRSSWSHTLFEDIKRDPPSLCRLRRARLMISPEKARLWSLQALLVILESLL